MKIAVASGKGGTGKTTIATNLAAFLARKRNVVLVDLDVEEPNTTLFFEKKIVAEQPIYKQIPLWNAEACTLCGLCSEVCNFHAVLQLGQNIVVFPELCHSCHACSELCQDDALPMKAENIGTLMEVVADSLHIIESRLNIGEEQAVPAISKAKEYAQAKYGQSFLYIYDSPPGTSCPVMEAIRGADVVVLVTEPTPFGLHDLKLAVETVRLFGIPFGVVINRYGIGNDDVVDYCKQKGIKVLAKIPNSREVAELYSNGELIYGKVNGVDEILQTIYGESLALFEGGKL